MLNVRDLLEIGLNGLLRFCSVNRLALYGPVIWDLSICVFPIIISYLVQPKIICILVGKATVRILYEICYFNLLAILGVDSGRKFQAAMARNCGAWGRHGQVSSLPSRSGL